MGHAASDSDLSSFSVWVSVHDSGPSLEPSSDSVSKPMSVPSSKDDPRVGILALESSMANGSVQVSFVESFGLTPSSSMSISELDSFVPENFAVYSSGAVALFASGDVGEWDCLSSVSVQADIEILLKS